MSNMNIKQVGNKNLKLSSCSKQMQQAIQIFEKELKHKLEYKASSKISPDTYLYKSFKFFDLYNNGYLNKSDFFKAIAKCGVVVDTHNIDAVYNKYCNPQDGNVYYKEFIEGLLFAQKEQSSEKPFSEMGNSKLGQQAKQTSSPLQKSQLQVGESRKTQQQQMKESRINKMYQQCDTFAQVTAWIKKYLREKGISALINLAVQLKSTDTSHIHKINKSKLMSKLDFLSQKAIELIVDEFTSNGSQQINYAELIYSLKGQLQSAQEDIIERAFQMLDAGNERQVPIQKVIDRFRYSHFKEEFTRGIQLYESFQGIDDGVFTDEDFIDFLGFVAFAFADPQQFISFVEKGYFGDEDARSQHSQRSNRSRQFKQESSLRNIVPNYSQVGIKELMQPDFRKNKQQPLQKSQRPPQSPGVQALQESGDKRSQSRRSQVDKKSSTTSVYVKEVEMIVLRIKKRLASKGSRGFLVFEKALRNADSDQDGLITLDQFKQVVRDLKIDITNNESTLMFDVFDPDSTSLISFTEMLHTLKGQAPQKRGELFERVWATVRASQQHTTFSQIRHSISFRGHPDIQTGRRYDDQIWKEIQQTIFLIQQLNEMPRSQTVAKKQFFEYMQNLSLTTSDDLLFQSILQNFWKMQSKLNINEMYAGSRKLFDPAAKSYLMDHHRYAVKGGSISSNAPFGTSNEPTNYFTEHSML